MSINIKSVTTDFSAWTIVKIFVISALLLAVAAGYVFTQERLVFGDGHPYDGGSYYEMANKVVSGEQIVSAKPFVYRIALPYLVGKFFATDIMSGFEIMNLGFAVVTLGLLLSLLTCVSRNWLVLGLICLLWVANPHAPFRFAPFFPAFTDSPAMCIVVALLLIQQKMPANSYAKLILVSLLTMIGVLFREMVLVATVSIAYAEWISLKQTGDPFKLRRLFWYAVHNLIPVAMGFLLIRISHHHVVFGYGRYSFSSAALEMAMFDITHPYVTILAFLMAYGPILSVMLVAPWQPLKDLFKQRPELQAFLFLVVVLALIGGHHIDRFWYWGFPLILSLMAISIEKLIAMYSWRRLLPLIISVVIAQGLAFRIFLPISNADYDALMNPGEPELWVFAPYGLGTNFAQMNASYMSAGSHWIVLAEYIAFGLWVWFLRARLKRTTVSS